MLRAADEQQDLARARARGGLWRRCGGNGADAGGGSDHDAPGAPLDAFFASTTVNGSGTIHNVTDTGTTDSAVDFSQSKITSSALVGSAFADFTGWPC